MTRDDDFEREGLLEGAEGEEARRARTELLGQLSRDGVPLDELKRAVYADDGDEASSGA